MIIDYLLCEVFEHEEALITDESRVSDLMSLFCEDRGKKVSDDQWEFVFYQLDLDSLEKDYGSKDIRVVPKDKRKQYKIEKKIVVKDSEVCKNQDLLNKIHKVFGVLICPLSLNRKFSEIALEISSKITPVKRKELEQKYNPLE